MATFSTNETLVGRSCEVPAISKAICDYFVSEGFSVKEEDSCMGGKEISISEGGIFKTLLGLRTALNISLRPVGDTILFKANVGMFGLQAVPTAITLLMCWPVLITQIWGLIKQAQLDDKALEIAKSVLSNCNHPNPTHDIEQYCYHCGELVPDRSRFCPHCGKLISV